MYCWDFGGQQPERHDPSGRIQDTYDEHIVSLKVTEKDLPRRGREPSVVSKKEKNRSTRNQTLLATSPYTCKEFEINKTYRRDCPEIQTNEERNHPFERELEKQRNQRLAKKAAETNPFLGMEVVVKQDHEVNPMHYDDERNLVNGKTALQLAMELERMKRLFECEKEQRTALKERLDHFDLQLKDLKNENHTSRKVESTELQEERTKNMKLREEVKALRAQNNNLSHQLQLLMFQHIPRVSTKFKDIGPVNYDINEDFDRICGYELTRTIGEGHYGTVKLGTNPNTKKNYAVKILNKEKISRFKELQQMALEVHVLTHYAHPNIIQLKDVIHAPDSIYLVMELCSMDLHTYHSKLGLTEGGAKQVIFGILNALEHLHANGICHLDLKPENILLCQSADLKKVRHDDIRICDFGLVNMVRKPESTKKIVRKGYACGTPGFFAPEMIIKKEFEGGTADMWSLGAILLEITLGFTKEWLQSYEKAESDPIAFQKGLEDCLNEIPRKRYPQHQPLLDIIHSCLSLEPAERISSRTALIHPWLDIGTGGVEKRQDN